MDGGAAGTAPAFDERRWRGQFLVAQLQDTANDGREPPQGPAHVLAAMRAAPGRLAAGGTFGPPPEGAVTPPTRTAGLGTSTGARTVDVFLSAGPRENYGTASYKSCGHGQFSTCSLWRIRIQVPGMIVVDVEQIAAALAFNPGVYDYVHVQPAVSPNGERLAYSSVVQQPDNTVVNAELVTRDLRTGAQNYTGKEAGQAARRQFPVWWDDSTLLYERSGGGGSTLYQGTTWPDFTNDVGMLGPDGATNVTTGYADANVHQNPPYKGIAWNPMDKEPRIVTFGGSVIGATNEHVPQVHGIKGEDPETFVLPDEWTPALASSECHHPAWRPDGTRILCTRYQAPEHTVPGNLPAEVRRIYEFGWSGTAWETPRALVRMLSREEIATIPTNRRTAVMTREVFAAKPDASGAECMNYVWKFAEWCVEERYLVATLYCTDSLQGSGVAYDSRVVLIDLGTPDGTATEATAYFDLVTEIERDQGAAFGTWSGVFSTCRAVDYTNLVPFAGRGAT